MPCSTNRVDNAMKAATEKKTIEAEIPKVIAIRFICFNDEL